MRHLLDAQAGTVARRQLAAAGVADHDIRRLVRRRDLVAVHPGVYVGHTGELSWTQRAWAAVLYAWPAALAGTSALLATDGPGHRHDHAGNIHVVVPHDRRVRVRDGVRIERRRGLEGLVLWNLGPPRLRYDEAVLDVVVAAATELDAIATLAAACGGRHTTARRLREAMRRRSRVPRRAWIAAVLDDVAGGTCSVLEHAYLRDVERAHGLLTARRQLRAVASGVTTYRDADIAGLVVVELDGRLFHDSAADRDRDMERDLDASLYGRTTVRLGWGQVVRCGPSCTALGTSPSSGDWDVPR
ncbi:MAG: hypothetical protein ABWY58_12770 [Aeromicrobium sp.]